MGKRKRTKPVRRKVHRVFSQAYINTGTAAIINYSARSRAVFPLGFEETLAGRNNEGRKAALRRKVEIMLEDVPKENHVVVLQVRDRLVLLYYNGAKTKWFFVRQTETTIEASHTYPSRQIAERYWKDGDVVFEIREECSPT